MYDSGNYSKFTFNSTFEVHEDNLEDYGYTIYNFNTYGRGLKT